MDFTSIDVWIAAQIRGLPVACHKGCSWCCHQLVVVTCRDDGRRILAAARERFTAAEFRAFAAQLREQAAAIAALGHDEAQVRRWSCPLLKDRQCVVYDVRPVACRSVFSPDVETCRAMAEAEAIEDLTPVQRALATDIGARAFRLQVTINDRRPIDGAVELRQLLVELLDEETGSGPADASPKT